eukprot:6175826-Prymnesium_polylepis.2
MFVLRQPGRLHDSCLRLSSESPNVPAQRCGSHQPAPRAFQVSSARTTSSRESAPRTKRIDSERMLSSAGGTRAQQPSCSAPPLRATSTTLSRPWCSSRDRPSPRSSRVPRRPERASRSCDAVLGSARLADGSRMAAHRIQRPRLPANRRRFGERSW